MLFFASVTSSIAKTAKACVTTKEMNGLSDGIHYINISVYKKLNEEIDIKLAMASIYPFTMIISCYE